jgi:hypothetical protein
MNSLKIQFWERALKEHLMQTYEYNKENGDVTRKWYGVKGPKPLGSLGSRTNNGDLLLTVNFDGKQWMIRIVKLAYFLETGKQFHKFVWLDGNRLNNRFENIVPNGPEIVSPEEYIKEIALGKEEQEESHRARRAELKRLADELAEQRKATAEREKKEKLLNKAAESVKVSKLLTPAQQLALANKKRDDEIADHERKLKSGYYEERDSIEYTLRKPNLDAREEVTRKVFEMNRKDRWKNGLYTKGSIEQAVKFLEDCNEFSDRLATNEELIAECGNEEFTKLAEGREKWEFDRMWAAAIVGAMSRHGKHFAESEFEQYKYKEQEVVGNYSALSKYWSGELERWLNEVDMEIPPPTEEFIAEAVKRMLEQQEAPALERATVTA